MTNATQTQPIAHPIVEEGLEGSYVSHTELLDILLSEHDSYVLSVVYKTDMLAKGKMRVSAKTAFPNGLFHDVRMLANVSYDYEAKVERRGGEEPTTKGNWQRTLVKVDANGKTYPTPFTVHKADIEDELDDGTMILCDNPRVYLRYEPPTAAQKASNFCAKDHDRYVDNDGNEVDIEDIKPHFLKKSPPASKVNHRTLTLSNVKRVYFKDRVYFLTS